VLERILARHPAALRAAVTDGPPADGGGAARTGDDPAAAKPRRARRLARYEQVITLRQDGWSLTEIAALEDLSRPTVRKYVTAGSFPEWSARRTKLSAGTAHASYLQARWQAGCRDATVLWQELQARGFTGSLRMV